MPADLLELTAALVDIPSVSHDEAAITDWIEQRLRPATWLTVDRIGQNLVARTQLGRPMRLIVAGHTDTVPINDNLPSRRDGDVLWGCGTSDMKAGLAVMLALATELAEPAVDVTWVFYEAEEVDARFNGLKRLFAERPDLLEGDVALLGEPTDGVIEAGCQGTLRIRVVLGGERAHTARPWMGRNAIHRAGELLARLAAYDERQPVIDGCRYREALQAVRIEGGVANNVVPDSVTILLNHRFAPDRTPDEAIAHVRATVAELLEDGDEFEVVDCANGAAPALSHPLLATLIGRNSLEVRAKLGWTDVARFAAAGIPAANFGPGDATLAHTRDERVSRRAVGADLPRVARVARARSSVAPENRDHPPVDRHVIGGEDHRAQPWIVRDEGDGASRAFVGLDRRLFAGDTGDDQLAVGSGGLLADDDEVAVEDPDVDHRVAADPQHEQLPVPGEVRRERVQLLDVLLGDGVRPGGDIADEGHVAHRSSIDAGPRIGVVAHLDRPRLGRVPPQVAESLEGPQVAVHRRR